MRTFRENPSKQFNDVEVVRVKDYHTSLANGEEPLTLPKADVLKFILADGT